MPLQTGQVLNNRYRIVKLLGQGGFGAVYRAWDVNFQLPCALKENSEVSPSAQRQFIREARILHTLRHPNLPFVKDYFLIDKQGQYLVMDYVEGDDLQALLDKSAGPLSQAWVIPWLCEVCQALDYMHNQDSPVIHRDIKPANIKITPQGKAVLVDFGISKIFNPELPTTLGAQAVTPGFSPFEQYGHAPTDARTDIYALGATAYTLLTTKTPPESISRLAGDELSAPSSLNADISLQVERAILRALQLNPADRYASALEFCQALMETDQPSVKPVDISAPSTVLNITPPTVVVQEEVSEKLDEAYPFAQNKQALTTSGKNQRKKMGRFWKVALITLIGLVLVAGGYFLYKGVLAETILMPPLPEVQEPRAEISGEWIGFIEENNDKRHLTEVHLILEQDSHSDELGCHLEMVLEPDVIEPRGCGGTFNGREIRLVDEKDQHYWGELEGERLVGKTAWGCFDCDPWGVFEWHR